MPSERWNYRWVNFEGTELSLALPDRLWPMGRIGDVGTLPFSFFVEESDDGQHGVVVHPHYQRGVITVPIGVMKPPDTGLWDFTDSIEAAMRPVVDDGVANEGMLYFSRSMQIDSPDQWQARAVPEPFGGWVENGSATRKHYITELSWRLLDAYWEDAAEQIAHVRTNLQSSWSQALYSITPGGTIDTEPVFEIDGPASGTITSVTIENLHTERKIVIANGLALATNQTAVISTGFMNKTVTIDDVDYHYFRSQDTSFWSLRPTINLIRITKNATSVSAFRVKYRKRRTGL